MDKIIHAQNLCYSYIDGDGNEVKALDNLNIEISPGEFVAVIGPNGSGKSTFTKQLNALITPTSGKLLVNDLDTAEADNVWNIRQIVGMVFQNPDNQIVAAIVEEDVAFGPENLGVPPAEIADRVTRALQEVGMEEYRQHAPHLLSGGQKQRVAIAGVLAMQPKCLVLDEPTAMLDPQGRKEVLSTVTRLNKEKGITIIYITHFMEEAVAADRVIVMDKGKIGLQGTPSQVFTQVELVKSLGLEVPLAAEVAYRLKQQGIKLPEPILTNHELAVALCR